MDLNNHVKCLLLSFHYHIPCQFALCLSINEYLSIFINNYPLYYQVLSICFYAYLSVICNIIYGYLWLSTFIYGYLCLSMVIYGYLCLSIVIISRN